MATIGHTLVGLSLTRPGPDRRRHRILASMWPGWLILGAHALDIVEWWTWLASPAFFQTHVEHNSGMVVIALIFAAWLCLAAFGRCREITAYAALALAIASHLLLDSESFQAGLAKAYGFSGAEASLPPLNETLVSEAWLYGGLLALAVLLQTLVQAKTRRKARQAGVLLGLLVVGAACFRRAIVWAPAYGVALIHAALVMRRNLGWRYAWSLLPLTPVLSFVAFEYQAARYFDRAQSLRNSGLYSEAIEQCELLLRWPSRSLKGSAHIVSGICHFELGKLEEAEGAMLEARRIQPDTFFCPYWLVQFYVDPRCRNTRFYRPDLAERILIRLQQGPYSETEKQLAKQKLEDLRDSHPSGGSQQPLEWPP